MKPTRVGAVLAFVLTLQFLLTLLWILVSWPPGGLGSLADAMAQYFLARANDPFAFILLNLYNVSFAVSAVALAVIMRGLFSDYPHRAQFAVYSILVAAAQYVASGVVPLVALPPLVAAGDHSAVNALVGVSTGLLLGATMASGFAVATFAWIGFSSARLPRALCGLMLFAGLIEMVEFGVPLILVLDPLSGAAWSIWLGTLLWNDRIAHGAASSVQGALGDQAA